MRELSLVNFNTKSQLTSYKLRKSGEGKSIFSKKYCVAIYDEAHLARVRNSRQSHALRYLSGLSRCRIAMTATPVITKPDDAWALGRLLRAEGFTTIQDEDLWSEEGKLLGREKRRMRKEAKEQELDNPKELVLRREIARGNISTQGSRAPSHVSGERESQGEAAEPAGMAMGLIPRILHDQGLFLRQRMIEFCIRRTQESLDFSGKPILEVEPFREHDMRVKLHPREQEVQEDLMRDTGELAAGRAREANVSFEHLHYAQVFTQLTCNL